MIATSVKFKGYRCFKNHWAGFDKFKPINVIIGRNNTGKSHLIDVVEHLAKNGPKDKQGWQFQCSSNLDETSLKAVFIPGYNGGGLRGDHWLEHGKFFLNQPINWELIDKDKITNLELTGEHPINIGLRISPPNADTDNIVAARTNALMRLCQNAAAPVTRKIWRRLRAERDLLPESPTQALQLDENGGGATNIIRRFLNSATSTINRDLIETHLLQALNHVFKGDGEFTGIDIHEHEEDTDDKKFQGRWEVVLKEKGKGRVALSRSGSGLKTVILVLLNLLGIPSIEKKTGAECVFAFEELENNLHPALLRRLLRYIEDYALREKCTVFLTTHSSIVLDLFGPVEHAQIIKVTHDGGSAETSTVTAHFEKQTLISELGVKPSDLLHANGIIWMEGPSDRIYMNRWIELASDGKLHEGRDYQCAFYAGSLLAQAQFTAPGGTPDEFANLLRLNSNIIVLCDSDRTAADGEGSELKPRVKRIADEVRGVPSSHLWITDAKEIENYLPQEALVKITPTVATAPGQFEYFFPSSAAGEGDSFWEKNFKRVTFDKVELATKTAPHMTKADLEKRFDWKQNIETIVALINGWNA